MAIPCDSNKLISSAWTRPGCRPHSSSPNSISCRGCRRPFSSRGSKSPASRTAVSILSTTMMRQRLITSSPISRRIKALEPAPLMWVPAASQAASNSGVDAVVTVLTISLSRTVSSAERAATTSMPRRSVIREQKSARRSGRRAKTLICRSDRTANSASRCPSACQPAPKTPATWASVRARQRVATPDAAAVRIMPIRSASRTACSTPVDAWYK